MTELERSFRQTHPRYEGEPEPERDSSVFGVVADCSAELLRDAVHTALVRPLNSVRQMCGQSQLDWLEPTKNLTGPTATAAQVGSMIGTVFDYVLLRKAIGRIAGETAQTALSARMPLSAITGLADGYALSPVKSGGNGGLLSRDRLNQGLVSAGSMLSADVTSATIGAASNRNWLAAHALPGSASGASQVYLSNLFNGQSTTWKDIHQGAAGGAIGGVLAGSVAGLGSRLISRGNIDGSETSYRECKYEPPPSPEVALRQAKPALSSLLEALSDDIKSQRWKLVLGDDVSGRPVALIVRDQMKRWANEHGLEAPGLVFQGAGYTESVRTFDALKHSKNFAAQMENLKSRIGDGRVLVVTEHVGFGDSVATLTENLHANNIRYDIATATCVNSERFLEKTRAWCPDSKTYIGIDGECNSLYSKSNSQLRLAIGVEKFVNGRVDEYYYGSDGDQPEGIQEIRRAPDANQQQINDFRKSMRELGEELYSEHSH